MIKNQKLTVHTHKSNNNWEQQCETMINRTCSTSELQDMIEKHMPSPAGYLKTPTEQVIISVMIWAAHWVSNSELRYEGSFHWRTRPTVPPVSMLSFEDQQVGEPLRKSIKPQLVAGLPKSCTNVQVSLPEGQYPIGEWTRAVAHECSMNSCCCFGRNHGTHWTWVLSIKTPNKLSTNPASPSFIIDQQTAQFHGHLQSNDSEIVVMIQFVGHGSTSWYQWRTTKPKILAYHGEQRSMRSSFFTMLGTWNQLLVLFQFQLEQDDSCGISFLTTWICTHWSEFQHWSWGLERQPTWIRSFTYMDFWRLYPQ